MICVNNLAEIYFYVELCAEPIRNDVNTDIEETSNGQRKSTGLGAAQI